MTKKDIFSVYQEKIPTVVSYDPEEKRLKIGEEAKIDGVNNTTNMFNFKMDLFKGEKEFSEAKKYWYGVTYSDELKRLEMDTFTARKVTGYFLSELIKNVDLPKHIIIGEPAVREQNKKDNFKRNIRDVFKDIGLPNISLFFEPFAVFQYYRFYENLFPAEDRNQIILVIDVGGGTFNSCIISTTNEGKLSRSGANMLPLGLQGEECGGSTIDLELAKIVIEKAKKRKLVWKDNPLDRAKSPVLFRIEEAKISLSNEIGSSAELLDDFEDYKASISLPKGSLHPEKEINELLTGNDLKKVIRSMWRNNYGKIITKTVSEAESKIKREIGRIDKVIIAGGSSKLPFMKQEVVTVLPTLVNASDIYIGSDIGEAVACGIACEYRELARSREKQDLTVGTLAPCLLEDLYVGFKVERRGRPISPKVNGKETGGLLFSSPFEIDSVTMKYELEIDEKITDRLFYFFSDKPLSGDEPVYLNTTDFVLSMPSGSRVSQTIDLELQIQENGTVKPIFNFRGKGSQAKKEVKPIECHEFFLDPKKIIEGEGFIGIDFGTSNSYLAKFISEENKTQEISYPDFTVRPKTTELLRKKQAEIVRARDEKILSKEVVEEHAKNNKYLMIFHSNKIEGNILSRGETEKILTEEKPLKPSKSQIEAINLENAFNWTLENLQMLHEEPENFIRHLNKLILKDIKKKGGVYRDGPVKLNEMEYVPPPALFVSEFMKMLGDEILKGVGERSPLEFAASIHTKLTMIHPFEDGNGRTARLIMNAILLSCHTPSLIINYDDKQRYFDALIEANNGDLSAFIEFIVECYDSEISDLLARVFISDETIDSIVSGEKVEKKVTDKSDIGPRLKALMAQKCSEINLEKENEYKNWSIGYTEIKKQAHELVNAFNSSPEHVQLGFQLKIFEYDMLSFDKYLDLSRGGQAPRTWYFRLDLSVMSSYEKILFFFQRASKCNSDDNDGHVNLCLARYDGSRYRRLKYEPVQLHEISHIGGKPKFVLNNGSIVSGEVGPMISDYVLCDIIENYI